jgi:hypothetical protein
MGALETQPALNATSTVIILSIPIAAVFTVIIFKSFSKSLSKPQGRKLGIDLSRELSNLHDEYNQSPLGTSEDKWEVKSLWIFPIKSCKGIEVHQARILPSG